MFTSNLWAAFVGSLDFFVIKSQFQIGRYSVITGRHFIFYFMKLGIDVNIIFSGSLDHKTLRYATQSFIMFICVLNFLFILFPNSITTSSENGARISIHNISIFVQPFFIKTDYPLDFQILKILQKFFL